MTGARTAGTARTALIITQGAGRRVAALRRLADEATLILAADGGARVARRAGILPHVLIGDGDSLDPATDRWLRAHQVPRRRFPREKDATDAELALQEAVRRGATEVAIFSAATGRADQTLANVMLLFAAARVGARARVVDGRAELRLARARETISGRRGDLVSLVALSPVVRGITTRGLRYPLREATLRRGSTLGLSNLVEEPPAVVRRGAGDLLLIHQRR